MRWAGFLQKFNDYLCRLHRQEAEKLHSEPLMTDEEIPSWLKYDDGSQLSAGQVRSAVFC